MRANFIWKWIHVRESERRKKNIQDVGFCKYNHCDHKKHTFHRNRRINEWFLVLLEAEENEKGKKKQKFLMKIRRNKSVDDEAMPTSQRWLKMAYGTWTSSYEHLNNLNKFPLSQNNLLLLCWFGRCYKMLDFPLWRTVNQPPILVFVFAMDPVLLPITHKEFN